MTTVTLYPGNTLSVQADEFSSGRIYRVPMPGAPQINESYAVTVRERVVIGPFPDVRQYDVPGGLAYSQAPAADGGVSARKGIRIGFIGTSLIQNNMQPAATTLGNSSRGWISWARFFSRGRFYSPSWYDPTVYAGWEPSGVAGTTRYFMGLNAGVSSQTIAQIAARKDFLVRNVKCDMVVVDGGTNDISGSMTAEQIHAERANICDYYLANGIPAVLLPILARDIATWPAGSTQRAKANQVNALGREYAKSRANLLPWDWNASWCDFSTGYSVPKTGYSNDGTHQAPSGAVADGESFAQFVANLLPESQPLVWSPDDIYDATNNPRGNILTNPFCTGTSGSLTNATGQVATGMRVNRQSGTATVVASKEARADGRGEYQVITITPGNSDSEVRFQTATANMTSPLAKGEWVRASCEVEISAHAYIRGVTLELWDSTNSFTTADMVADSYTTPAVRWPNRELKGLLETNPMQHASANPSCSWRLRIVIGNTGEGASGDLVVKVGSIEWRKVDDPRELVEYQP